MPYFLDNPSIEFRQRPILFIDLELTGLDVKQHEIIEVAALLTRYPDYRIENSYYTKVIPTHPKTGHPESLKIAGYSPQEWANAIPLRQMLLELSDFAPNCTLAGWSVQTEWDFINAALESEKLPYFYDHRLLEIYTLAYAKFIHNPRVNHLSLQTAAQTLNIPLLRHKPDSDIKATYEIFKLLTT